MTENKPTRAAGNPGEPVTGGYPAQSEGSAEPAGKVAALLAWLEGYEPMNVDEDDWGRVRDFVVGHARALVVEHHINQSLDRYVRVLTKAALHAATTGQRLQTRTVLDPYTVNQFAKALSADGDNNAGTYQSHLRYIGELLNPTAPWERRAPVSRRTVAPPYSDQELVALEHQIAKNKPALARAGQAFLELGRGAGLDGRWAPEIGPEHVIDDEHGVAIAVAGRIVPVLAEREHAIRALVASTPHGERLHGMAAKHKNAYSSIARALKLDPGTPTLNGGRLRSTWILTHLTRGTRLPELVEAAGTVGIGTFADLLELVPPLDDDPLVARAQARKMLRGG